MTFAFTDIEGSTQRWDRDRAAMQNALRRHDVLIRSAIEAHGGHVFKTLGDAFCAAFSRPEDAIAATLDAQRALGAEDFGAVGGLRVRVALHTGTADERDGDYFGPTVNRVARLLGIGHGGQVLVSGVTAVLVQGDLPRDVGLQDLGEHRLRDLARPEHVYQLTAPDFALDFAPLKSLDALPNNLPRILTSFIGREAEVAEITALVEKNRLVTLVGSGGIGKTRTSLQVAANLLDVMADGVWFVEMAPLASGEYIPSTVAQALGLTLAADGDPVDNLARALQAKVALLVFDNCEHLLEPAAHAIETILRKCPHVRILASSRQGLGIAGEVDYRMPSLGVPTAIGLFVDRARAVDHRFALTDENAPIVADICRRLDGIPFAIELAAARARILSPRQLREHLDERFRVLTGGSRDVLPRQKTLRAMIDWSYDLLDERERTLFRRLGIFVNGFTLDGAAAAAGSGDGLDAFDTFDVLASLVDKSLVLAEPAGDALRYRLLESTRVYAREKLDAEGERPAAAARHLRYLRDYFTHAGARYEQTARWPELDAVCSAELEDVRAALDWAIGGGDTTTGGELLAEIRHGWQNLGLHREGITRAETLLAILPVDDPCLLARLWIVVAFLEGELGRRERGFAAAANSVVHARACGDRAILASSLSLYSFCAIRSRGYEDAEPALAEAEGIAEASVATRLQLLGARARLSGLRGDLAAQARAYERLRQEHRSLGNASAALGYTLNLAETQHSRGETEQAIAILRESLESFRTHGNRLYLAGMLANFAGYLVAVDELPAACAIAREAIRELAPREPESASIAQAMEHLALALALRGDVARAALLEGYVEEDYRTQGFVRETTETKTFDRLSTLLSERFDPAERSRLLAEGRRLAADAAIALALEDP